jgi:hypothetical protein
VLHYKVIRNAKAVRKTCPRCSNVVEMQLVRDRDITLGALARLRLDFPGLTGYYSFRLKCPICIYEESLSLQQAYSLMGR